MSATLGRVPTWVKFTLAGAVATALYFLTAEVSAPSLIYPLIGLASGVTILVAARGMSTGRVAWRLFGTAQILWCLADLTLIIYEAIGKQVPYPSIADVIYLLGYPVAIIGIGVYLRATRPGPLRWMLVDAALVAIPMGMIAYELFVDRYIAATGFISTGDIVGLAYPVLDLFMFGAAGALLLTPRHSPTTRLLGLAISLLLLADMFYSAGILAGTYRLGVWYDGAWLMSYVFWAAAALHAKVHDRSAKPLDDSETTPIPVTLVMVSLFVVVRLFEMAMGYPYSTGVSLIGGMAVITLALLRTQYLIRRARASEELFRRAFHSRASGMAIGSVAGELIEVNDAFADMLGYEPRDLVGMTAGKLTHPDDRTHLDGALQDLMSGKVDEIQTERLLSHRDGRPVCMRLSLGVSRDDAGKPVLSIAKLTDLTRLKEMEESLYQARKMEAIGQMAAGVAHDFNNILSIIKNYSAFALSEIDAESPIRDDIREIARASQKGANIVKQLQTLSRNDAGAGSPVSLNGLLLDLNGVFTSFAREGIDVKLDLSGSDTTVLVDPVRIERVVMNLMMNAKDAMEAGGRLTIGTTVEALSDQPEPLELRDGEYVVLRLTDTGTGMTEEVKRRLFDPFFTTKGPGNGTGLGLAMAYGIVGEARGAISVRSELGSGSTFSIFLPLHAPESGSPIFAESTAAATI